MGRLIDGDWRTDVSNRASKDEDATGPTFDGRVGTNAHLATADRYHLYVSRACPWAHGAVLVRRLLGLDGMTVDVVDPVRDPAEGWTFTPAKAGCTPDTVLGSDHLREVYQAADPDYTGRVTVPVLWDREAESIVAEDSLDIMRTLATAFGDRGPVDPYPEARREAIDAVVEDIYDPINRGVYWAGFADDQAEYERAVRTVFDALDRWEDVLADQRFLLGADLTLADLRLFPTLVRFDPVYHTHFKCTVRRLVDYPNLWGYARDLYQLPGVAETVNLDHIKAHYYRSHDDVNPSGVVPVGPDVDWTAPHDRDELGPHPFAQR